MRQDALLISMIELVILEDLDKERVFLSVECVVNVYVFCVKIILVKNYIIYIRAL